MIQKSFHKNYEFLSCIHNQSTISSLANIGAGVVVMPYSLIGPKASLADFCFVGPYSDVGHDVDIGTGSNVFSRATIAERSSIGVLATMAASSVILKGGHLADECTLSSGSVLRSRTAARTVWHGNPARQIHFPRRRSNG